MIDDFLIPTDFNGDRLATMEAIYEDGTNAGPHDWTSFKEFGYTFMPLYDSNHIKLTDRFFNEIRDGEILLKMHFWSGNIVEYKLKKEGINILGESYIVEEPEPEPEPEPKLEPESKPDSDTGLAPELEPGKMETSKK